MKLAAAALAAVLALGFALPAPAPAQTLLIPLTGRRVKMIETAALFNTLFTDFFLEDDDTTYVQTGDIPAMWLRDSSAQTIPYVRYQTAFPVLRNRFTGVIERNARNILTDAYANAFQADYHVWERKWEIDSLAWPVVLAWIYWHHTRDRSVFTPELHVALRQIVFTYNCEEHHSRCSTYRFAHPQPTVEAYNESTGLIWSAFRASDDPVQYRFNVPENQFAVVALREIERLAIDGYRDATLSSDARALAERVQTAVGIYGRYFDARRRVWTYAYETDGYGHYNLMDDANIPNLTTLPYVDWCSPFDPTYLQTRSFTLSMDNPFYFSGRYAQGLGSPHTPYGYVWPLGLIGRSLSSTSSAEMSEAITTLAETVGESGMFHESFDPDAYWRFTRAEFGWANALTAELLFRTLAGDPATQFSPGGPVMPYENRVRTPALVPFVTQLENAAELNATLANLLRTGGAMPHGP